MLNNPYARVNDSFHLTIDYKTFGLSEPLPMLSDLMSEGIVQAVEDMEAIEDHDLFEIDMYRWVSYKYGEEDNRGVQKRTCAVCMAGSIMARRGDMNSPSITTDDVYEVHPGRVFTLDQAQKASAFDTLRMGKVKDFIAEYLNRPNTEAESFNLSKDITESMTENGDEYVSYEDDPEGFKNWCRLLAHEFKQRGY